MKSAYEKQFHLEVEPTLGFDDTFAIEIRGEDARRLGLKTISQAARYTPQWRAGFGYEFMERPDGYKGFVKTYGLNFAAAPRIMDLGLLTRALKDKQTPTSVPAAPIAIHRASRTNIRYSSRTITRPRSCQPLWPMYSQVSHLCPVWKPTRC